MHGTIREDLKRKIGHDHGVRDTKDVVGVGRAVEGEDADLRVSRRWRATRVSRRVDGVEARELSVGRDAIGATIRKTLR